MFKKTAEAIATVLMIITCVAILTDLGIKWRRDSLRRPNMPAAEDIEAKSWVINAAADEIRPAKSGLVLVEFSDFQCPFCGRYVQDTLPMIRKEFVETGRLNYVFRNFPLTDLHPAAMSAAAAASCARKSGQFWEMHDWLFQNQSVLERNGISAHLNELSGSESTDCVAQAEVSVRSEVDEGRRLGVEATPTFFLGEVTASGEIALKRKIGGAVSSDVFKAAINELLQKASTS